MAKKHLNDDKGESFQRSRGRRSDVGDNKPKSNTDGRERNVGHDNAEEHSRVSKKQ